VPAVNCHHIPDPMSFAEAAVVEPLSCAVHAIKMAPPRVGESVLVVGGGTMGLLTGQLLARGGASVLALVERKRERLPIGTQVGFGPTHADVPSALGDRPQGYDLVVDAPEFQPPSRQRSAPSPRVAGSCRSASHHPRRASRSPRTGFTTKRSQSSARWPSSTPTHPPCS
jgi:threonine dehydrogenase-like Zn-dependent dehydrogenase